MDHWTEIKTAYEVVRLGTVSAAADALNVHRATVIRHIDLLEAELGTKLFQRHARGYTPTEAGQDLLRVAKTTDEQFNQLAMRTKGSASELSGELVITSLESMASILMPAINTFRTEYPNVIIRYITSGRVIKLEYGEAHIAIRAGPKPTELDNVVQPYITSEMGLYASKDYIDRKGTNIDITDHDFIGPHDTNVGAPFFKWLLANIPSEQIVLRTTNESVGTKAVLSGIGVGFMETNRAKRNGLVEIVAPKEEWSGQTWLVTHVDLHRTAKVQAFLNILKQRNI
ncbi:LysR family transcriptional regulator [Amylibacter sp. SFDW26]|uniref:LysR family transcriptional regulator n=1 Tax=Amylibacter sp. SFDW26 TaxID=2652722 RepID=UPI001262A9FA|nr:LysR family transcriptional regulator [Amylibacter sp. SFDW26]KAB7614322.1 LysR family transcriptional regulator [Amylibacter sp. SFDW26]